MQDASLCRYRQDTSKAMSLDDSKVSVGIEKEG